MARPLTPLPERILKNVVLDENGCWIWQLARTAQGYAHIRLGANGETSSTAHRVSYEQFIGPIPEGLQIDHLCRVRHCVNPGHMEPVTNRENGLRGVSPAAINARKTHCKNGHEFSLENTMHLSRGERVCRTCRREYRRRRAA